MKQTSRTAATALDRATLGAMSSIMSEARLTPTKAPAARDRARGRTYLAMTGGCANGPGNQELDRSPRRRHCCVMTELHRFQSFDGVSIGYRTLGDPQGWPTLMLHGFLAGAETNWFLPGSPPPSPLAAAG